MSTEIRGLGGILTGDLAAPVASGSVIRIEDGRIAAIGASGAEADTVIDARGAVAMPGLWDGAAALYFGDHEPQFSARGAIAAAVEYGTTTLVIAGRVDVPGWVGDARSRRELAVLTAKSWRHDRPRGIKVLPGVVEADPAWTSEDLADLAANGATTMLLRETLDPASTDRLAGIARAAGLRIAATVEHARTDAAALVSLKPDMVMLHVVDRATALAVLEGTAASVGIVLTAGVTAATDVVCGAADRGLLGRVFLGSGLPGRSGVVPGAMALFLDALGATTGLNREQLVALASGNVSRASSRTGGTLAIGQPADLVLIDGDGSGPSGWARAVQATFIDGTPAWTREASG